jgi:hypothetical protein
MKKNLISRLRAKINDTLRSKLARIGKLIGRNYCPVCEHRVLSWQPFRRAIGHGETQPEPGGRLCPHCDSFERTRHFVLYLNQEEILTSQPKMLHFAPERGLEPILRHQLGEHYVTTDLFMPGVDRKEDITDMTFNDNEFDFIYCSNVLEHIDDDAVAISELFRILSPGGYAIVQVPIKGKITYEDPSITDPNDRFKHFGQADHVRYYGEDIEDRLALAGFEVTPFCMLDVLQIDGADTHRMNLGKRELIHKCKKPAS